MLSHDLAPKSILHAGVLITATLLLFGSCTVEPPTASAAGARAASDERPTTGTEMELDFDLLINHWVHSAEEDDSAGDVEIYRTEGSQDFPPRRFRMQFIFHRDGRCEWFFLAPDDAHRFVPGRWSIDGSVLHIEADEATMSYRIVGLTRDLLRLKPL